jgi:hypothetical protein
MADKSTEKRLETAVLTIDSLMSKIDPIASGVAAAKTNIDSIDRCDTQRSSVGSCPPDHQCEISLTGMPTIVNAQPFLKEMPASWVRLAPALPCDLQNDKSDVPPEVSGLALLSFRSARSSFLVTNIYDIDAGVRPGIAPDPIKRYSKESVSGIYATRIFPRSRQSVKNFQALYKPMAQLLSTTGSFHRHQDPR